MEDTRWFNIFYKVIFLLLLGLLVVFFFWTNFFHFAHQGIFYCWHLPLAQQLHSNHRYQWTPDPVQPEQFPTYLRQRLIDSQAPLGANFQSDHIKPATYPMWGYPMLLVPILALRLDPAVGITVVQAIMCLASIGLGYAIFRAKARLWHLPFFIPWILLFSIRWSDALTAFLVIAFIYLLTIMARHSTFASRLPLGLAAGLCMGAIYNVRSEYLLFPFVLIGLMLWFKPPVFQDRKSILSTAAMILIPAFLSLIPWMIHSYDGKLHLGSTNSGGVLYITLGQLPDNPWQREHLDIEAYRLVHRHGVSNPWSSEGNDLLQSQFIADVRAHPGDFIKKIAYNFIQSFSGDMELGCFHFPENRDPTQGMAKHYSAITKNMIYYKCEYASAIFRWIYRLMILAFIILALVLLKFRRASACVQFAVLCVSALLIYKWITCSLIQYQPRHFQLLWLPLLMAMIWITQQSIRRKKEQIEEKADALSVLSERI